MALLLFIRNNCFECVLYQFKYRNAWISTISYRDSNILCSYCRHSPDIKYWVNTYTTLRHIIYMYIYSHMPCNTCAHTHVLHIYVYMYTYMYVYTYPWWPTDARSSLSLLPILGTINRHLVATNTIPWRNAPTRTFKIALVSIRNESLGGTRSFV